MSDDPNPVRRLIRDHLSSDDATGWFEKLYARAADGELTVPWARMSPDADLMRWLDAHPLSESEAKTALVVGCGLGDDAEALAAAGYTVTAFDISETAIAWCKQRFPDSDVEYVAADLFALPASWTGAFDFVLESRTIQALPWEMTEPAIEAISAVTASGGVVLVLCLGRDPEEDRRGIPWRLSRRELEGFAKYGLRERRFEDFITGDSRRFLVEYIKEHSA